MALAKTFYLAACAGMPSPLTACIRDHGIGSKSSVPVLYPLR